MPKQPDREKFKELCRAHYCRCTNQRIAVYEFICGNREHPDVDRVWQAVREKMPSITRESVFRILMELAEWGIVYRMDKIINARFDGVPHPHGHFICRECGAVIDFKLPEQVALPAETNGFLCDHVELRISGICAACAEKKTEKQSPPLRENTTRNHPQK